jgi:DNA-binding CsgD family transcriptional regulator
LLRAKPKNPSTTSVGLDNQGGLVDFPGADVEKALAPFFMPYLGIAAPKPRLLGSTSAHNVMKHGEPMCPVDFLATISTCTSPVCVADQLNQLRERLDLPWGTACQFNGLVDPVVVLTVPSAQSLSLEVGYAQSSFNSVLSHVRSTTMSVVWDAAPINREGSGEGEFYSVLAAFAKSMQLGLTCSTAGSQHGMQVVIQTPASTENDVLVVEQVIQLHLFALHLSEAGRARCRPRQVAPLSSRERKVLSLTINGCSTWEIASALRISESLASKIGRDAAIALECAGRHHAAARALHMGWLPELRSVCGRIA